MKKMNVNKKQNWKGLLGMMAVILLTLLVSCEKNNDPIPKQRISENSVIGEYSRTNATIVNSENGVPQQFVNLKALIGEELLLLDNGSFSSPTIGGTWVRKNDILTLSPTDGSSLNLVVTVKDNGTLDLLQNFEPYNEYASGIIDYTFTKKEFIKIRD